MILTFFLGLLNFAAAEAQSEQVSFLEVQIHVCYSYF